MMTVSNIRAYLGNNQLKDQPMRIQQEYLTFEPNSLTPHKTQADCLFELHQQLEKGGEKQVQ